MAVSVTGLIVVTVPTVSIPAVPIGIVRVIVVTVISVRIVPAPPPRKAHVADEDDIIRESVIVMAPIAVPVAPTPVAAAPRTNSTGRERVSASHCTEMAATATTKATAAEASPMETTAAEACPMETTTTEAASATAVASCQSGVSQGDRCDANQTQQCKLFHIPNIVTFPLCAHGASAGFCGAT